MITILITNRVESQQIVHPGGPIEIGRGPPRDTMPRLVVQDAFVSRDHLRIVEVSPKQVRIENISTKAPIAVDNHALLTPGTATEYTLPVRLGVGETVIDITVPVVEVEEDSQYHTVQPPQRRDVTIGLPNLLQQEGGAAVPVTELVGWLETVLTVQRATQATEFYTLTAKAIVEQIGLDNGLVLLHEGHAWRAAAATARSDRDTGRAFSHTLLERVLKEKRTFYMTSAALGSTESLTGVHSVVASPIIDGDDVVIGVVYGTRLIRSRSREIGPLEAQIVQLLASAVSIGLTRLKQDAEAGRLRVEKEAAEQADRTKSQFLAMVSHELRTPLTTIIGYSEMVLEQIEADGLPQYQGDLQQIHTAANHLLALINDILDLSKIEAGKMELAHDPFDPGALLRDLMRSVEPLAKKNKNNLALTAPADLGTGNGDATRVRQCVLNLIGNACKFTQAGTVTVTASRVKQDGIDWLRVAVTDTGIGMNPEQMGRLFQAFSQVDSSSGRKHGGTGLGLAISQKLCNAMGGQITVESQIGHGSTFTLQVPAVIGK